MSFTRPGSEESIVHPWNTGGEHREPTYTAAVHAFHDGREHEVPPCCHTCGLPPSECPHDEIRALDAS